MKNGGFIASIRGAAELHRGDIIVFEGPTQPRDAGGTIYVKRVAAPRGDRIEL